MKKKTVITTEKHEVWVIRSPADEINEEQTNHHEPEVGLESLRPLDRKVPTDEVPEDQ